MPSEDAVMPEYDGVAFHFNQIAKVYGIFSDKFHLDDRFLHFLVELEAKNLVVTVVCGTKHEYALAKKPGADTSGFTPTYALVPGELLPQWLRRNRLAMFDAHLIQWEWLNKLIEKQGGPESN